MTAIACAFASMLQAQNNCGNWQPGAPAFAVTCYCNPSAAGLLLQFQGSGRIGNVQLFSVVGAFDFRQPNLLVLGFPAAAPQPVPTGLVVCNDPGAGFPSVTDFRISPGIVISFMPNNVQQYWLNVPAVPALAGTTIYAQYLQQLVGLGAVPFATSPLIGFTIQP
jgi:hypothetical protein